MYMRMRVAFAVPSGVAAAAMKHRLTGGRDHYCRFFACWSSRMERRAMDLRERREEERKGKERKGKRRSERKEKEREERGKESYERRAENGRGTKLLASQVRTRAQ